MALCSRRAWKTPSGFTTWPTPGLLRRRRPSTFQSSNPDRKTAGVYHDNHSDPAADAALPVPVLSRHNPSRCPTFIPAFTLGEPLADHRDGSFETAPVG